MHGVVPLMLYRQMLEILLPTDYSDVSTVTVKLERYLERYIGQPGNHSQNKIPSSMDRVNLFGDHFVLNRDMSPHNKLEVLTM